jgi:hypothetical protein
MPALKGSLTYARFFVEGEPPKDFREKFMRAIRLRAMQPLEADDDVAERSGWCAIGEPFDVDLHYEGVFYNNFINLGFRTDRWSIPGPLLRTRVREAQSAYLVKRGRERPEARAYYPGRNRSSAFDLVRSPLERRKYGEARFATLSLARARAVLRTQIDLRCRRTPGPIRR